MKPKDMPLLSFCVIARNEENSLPALFDSLLAQTYPLEDIEVVLVDGDSDDGTVGVMRSFADAHGNVFKGVLILNNPARRLAAGWNVALRHMTCPLVLRMDAHAMFPDDYIERVVSHILEGEDICGGRVENLPGADTDEAYVTNMAENSLFGGSIALFRHADEPRYVDTAAFAVYRREVFDAAGPFDERLARTEDNEMHWRIRQAGYRFFYDPAIVSQRWTRDTFGGLLKQKYLNGYWIGATMGVCPRCFSLYHFVPAAFVLAIVVAVLLAAFGVWWPLVALCVLYALADAAMTATSIASSERRPALCALLPAMFLVLHVGYGAGTWVGLTKAPSLRRVPAQAERGGEI